MEKLKGVLIELGLSELECKFYLSSLESGSASIGELAKKTGIDRSTAYFIADELKNKGFLEEDFKKYKKLVFVKEPSYLIQQIAQKRDRLIQKEKELNEIIPQISASYSRGDFKPILRFYHGYNGLNEIRDDIFSTKGDEILLYTNQKSSEMVFSEKDRREFIKKRIKFGKSIRVLAIDEPSVKKLIGSDDDEIRVTRLLPKNTFFTAETYIYGDKVAMLDFNKDIIGFVVKSAEFTQAQRSIFEALWTSLKK
jgi:sugar-specific transcriptional regulator TrmB